MRIIETAGPRRSRVITAPTPVPGPDELLIRVVVSGVCASDTQLWAVGGEPGHHGRRGAIAGPAPIRYGHEFAGIVEGTGADVVGYLPGDAVTGFAEHTHASHILAASDDIVRLPRGVPVTDGLGEPLACVVDAVGRAGIIPGDRVAVVGLGSMGQLAVEAALALGAGEVVIADCRQHRVALARERLSDPRIRVIGDAEPPCPVVIEFAGTADGLHLAGGLTAPLGRLVVGGYHLNGPRGFELDWWYRGLTVICGFDPDRPRMRKALAAGIAMAGRREVDLRTFITHRFPLEELDSAYELLTGHRIGFLKAVLEP